MEEGKNKFSKEELKELKHHTRRLSIKEGIFWSIRSSFGDHYVAPFAISTGMSNGLITILNSLWNLGPAGQILGSKQIKKNNRKSILVKTVFWDSIGWLLMALIAVLYLKNIATNILPYLIIIDLSLILLASGIGHPAWFSWMGDLVDAKYRGRWFSKRTTIISFTTIVLALTASFGLEYFKKINQETLAFIILFSIAFLARFYCTFIFKKHYEPELRIKKKQEFSFKHFLIEAKETNLGKFTIFRTMLAFAVGLTSPLVSIYLLRFLNLDYVSYIAIMLSGTLFSAITLNLWGRIADKYGNYKAIVLTTFIIPLTPLLWILSPSKIYLFIVPAILGGTAWSAFIMASGNFIYDNTKKDIRGKAISYFNLLTGIGAFIGGICSAYFIDTLQISWIEPLYLIFIASFILRIIIVAFWIPKLNEIKRKKQFNGISDIKNILFKETKPTIIEDLHQIAEIRRYLKER